MKAAVITFIAAAISMASIPPSFAQDHPLLGHFEGAKQVGYKAASYDEARIIVGPIEEKNSTQQRGAGWQTVEGKVTTLYYQLPAGRTSLEALRNYQSSLSAKGFEVPFTCSTEAATCFSGGQGYPGLFLGMALDGSVDLPKLSGDFVRNYFLRGNGRYLYAKLERPGVVVHVSIAFSDDETRGRVVVARVIETGKMESGKIAVTDTSELQRDIDARGKVDVYGILFDFDKANIKPDSQAQLKAIADLLTKSPNLRLDIVGHTDNQGGASYNLNLSALRASAVVDELASQYGIERGRLSPSGKGMAQPVASNSEEAGRALNRRVELVRR